MYGSAVVMRILIFIALWQLYVDNMHMKHFLPDYTLYFVKNVSRPETTYNAIKFTFLSSLHFRWDKLDALTPNNFKGRATKATVRFLDPQINMLPTSGRV